MIDFDKPKTSVPAVLDATSWETLEPVFQELVARPLRTGADFDQWMVDRSELDAACSEAQADLYITMTCSTEDAAAQKAYADFIEEIVRFKMKRRKHFRKTKGHRSYETRVRVKAINL